MSLDDQPPPRLIKHLAGVQARAAAAVLLGLPGSGGGVITEPSE